MNEKVDKRENILKKYGLFVLAYFGLSGCSQP
jgi:hypothetical protein